MNRSESIGNLAAALAKAQGEMKNAAKDSRNPHFGSKYADLASVVDAAEPLAKHEISYIQIPATPEAGLVSMTTLLLHSSGEWLQSDTLTVQAKDAGPQAVGSCLTYLRRYQLAAMVGIAPEDDDAEAGEGRTVQKVPQMQTQRPQQPVTRPPLPNANHMAVPKVSAPVQPIKDKDIPF